MAASGSSSTNAQTSLPCHTTASESAVHSVSNVCDIMDTESLSIEESVCIKILRGLPFDASPNLNVFSVGGGIEGKSLL